MKSRNVFSSHIIRVKPSKRPSNIHPILSEVLSFALPKWHLHPLSGLHRVKASRIWRPVMPALHAGIMSAAGLALRLISLRWKISWDCCGYLYIRGSLSTISAYPNPERPAVAKLYATKLHLTKRKVEIPRALVPTRQCLLALRNVVNRLP